jgi:hypothetical protein
MMHAGKIVEQAAFAELFRGPAQASPATALGAHGRAQIPALLTP